eukprot:scaffold258316_cov28-Tisochrysis_lutea.AAC.1
MKRPEAPSGLNHTPDGSTTSGVDTCDGRSAFILKLLAFSVGPIFTLKTHRFRARTGRSYTPSPPIRTMFEAKAPAALTTAPAPNTAGSALPCSN